MAWTNGGPGSHIPEATKRTVRRRQHNQCNTIDATVCTGSIDQFDHIHNIKAARVDRRRTNHPDQIQGLCVPCHKIKTQREAQAGRQRGKRRPQLHPADAATTPPATRLHPRGGGDPPPASTPPRMA